MAAKKNTPLTVETLKHDDAKRNKTSRRPSTSR